MVIVFQKGSLLVTSEMVEVKEGEALVALLEQEIVDKSEAKVAISK